MRTKRLNIRYLIRYNGNFARYAQGNKMELAIKYDYTNPDMPVYIGNCARAKVVTHNVPGNPSQKRLLAHQGSCTAASDMPHLNGFTYGPDVRENEWINVESEFDLNTGWYRTYVTTQDGVFNQTLTSELYIGAVSADAPDVGSYGAPAEPVPNPYWWGSIDCTAGCFWSWPDDGGTTPRPADTYIWYSHFMMSNTRIGPPAGFVQQGN